jgi:RNAse (barnase) inhibitor barstar
MLFAAEAMHDGLFVAWINGKRVENREDFLTAVALALEFPGYYGRNWDAFEECIRDLEWLPARGYVLVLDEYERFAQRDPESWNIALAILKEAANTWASTETPMYVLLRGARDQPVDVSALRCVPSAGLPELSDRQLVAE